MGLTIIYVEIYVEMPGFIFFLFIRFNASADVAALHQLYDTMPQEYCGIENKIVLVEKIKFNIARLRNQKQILPRFDVLITGKIMNKTQAESVSGRGLTPGDLRKIFERSGKTGLL